jgi:monoterpene epsilon-lactone hydrolase
MLFPTALMLAPAVFAFPLFVSAQVTQATGTPPPGPATDTSVIAPDGTAHITRVVPLPALLSSEAKARWSKAVSDAPKPQSLAERRTGTDTWQTGAGKKSAAVYPVKITEGQSVGGVPVRIIDPLPHTKSGASSGPGTDPWGYSVIAAAAYGYGSSHPLSQMQGVASNGGTHTIQTPPRMFRGDQPLPIPPIHTDRVLICLHGGGFNSDSGSYTESIPIANLTRTRVVSVLYRLAPEHPYPAALEDAVSVYRQLLKTYKPANIAIYGTSAGAILTAEVGVRLKQLNLPEPGALGVFSGFGDMTAVGDSSALFTLEGYSGHLDPPALNPEHHSIDPEYTATANPHDDVLSPDFSDLSGLPPTLFITSTRDILLSGTSDMQRAWARDGVPNQLVVFDGLPHAFWNDVSLPESREAYATMARFFDEHLGR